ncbi:MAG: hypothetical protein V3R98_08975 [Alphaproteobacteria bacterium]
MAGSSTRWRACLVAAVLAGLTAACAKGPTGHWPHASTGRVESADPDVLIGLPPSEISAMLGEPELRRQEPPAEVWQYRTDRCVFDLYFYTEDGASQAIYYEARDRANGDVDVGQCLGSVVRRDRIASAPDELSAIPERL